MQLESIYQELSPFYILIYLHDLKSFSVQNLRSLLYRLKGGLHCDDNEQKIHDALIQISNTNKDNKLNKRKEKFKPYFKQTMPKEKIDQKSLSINTNMDNQSTKYSSRIFGLLDQSDLSINDSCLLDHEIYHKEEKEIYQDIQKQSGKIYDGKLYIQLEVSCQGKSATVMVDFIVNPQAKQSTINNVIKMKINPKATNSLQLFINKRKNIVEVKEGENIIGLDYLRQYKVILQSNYRPQVSRFSLKYTN